MKSVEIEKTYLVKYIPDNLKNFNNKEILDIYSTIGKTSRTKN